MTRFFTKSIVVAFGFLSSSCAELGKTQVHLKAENAVQVFDINRDFDSTLEKLVGKEIALGKHAKFTLTSELFASYNPFVGGDDLIEIREKHYIANHGAFVSDDPIIHQMAIALTAHASSYENAYTRIISHVAEFAYTDFAHKEYAQPPHQTIIEQKGDCALKATALTSLLQSVGISSYLAYVDTDSDGIVDHVANLVDVTDLNIELPTFEINERKMLYIDTVDAHFSKLDSYAPLEKVESALASIQFIGIRPDTVYDVARNTYCKLKSFE
jgi:hypothetical protein